MTDWQPSRERIDEPLYLGIAAALAADIDDGRLAAGDRLPTQRQLSRRLGVSLGTVTRAYAEAERRGLVRGEIGRGTFVAAFEPLTGTSATPTEPGDADLSINLPLHALDPDLGSLLSDLSRDRDLQQLLRYQQPAGAARHRTAGAEWLSRCGLDVAPDRVLACAGAQNALSVLLPTLMEPGDTLLTGAFTYPGIKAAAELHRVHLVGLPTDGEGIAPEALDEASGRPRVKAVYCMPTLQNPTCASMSEERRRQIAAIAERRGVTVIEDDVYRLLHPDPPPPIAALAPDHTCYVASVSKVLAGGLRIAFMAPPPAVLRRLERAIWATNWMAAPLLAEIARRWIADGTVDRVLLAKRDEANARQRLLAEAVGGVPGLTVEARPFGYHAWLGLPAGRSADAVVAEARRRRVLVSPGGLFAIGEPAAAGRRVRVCLGAVDDRRSLALALGRLAATIAGEPASGPALV